MKQSPPVAMDVEGTYHVPALPFSQEGVDLSIDSLMAQCGPALLLPGAVTVTVEEWVANGCPTCLQRMDLLVPLMLHMRQELEATA